MSSARLPLLVVLLIAGALAAAVPLTPTSSPAAWRLRAMSASFGPQRVRLTIDLAGSGRLPPWQAWLDPSQGALVIDVRDVDASNASVPHLGPDALVTSWSLRRPNFLSAQWVVRLGYMVPSDHIRAEVVGHSLVVDVGRSYSTASSLPVTRNVRWRRHEVRSGDNFYMVNELEVQLDGETQVGVAHAHDSVKSVEEPSEMAQRKHALAMVNGGFFGYSTGALSLIIDEGRVVVPNVSTRPPRTALGITRDGRILMNRVEVKDDRPHAIDGAADWSAVTFAVGAGPRLVRDGHIALTTDEEGLGKHGNDITRKAGRTAVARLRNGHLLFVTISGYRSNHGQGWSLEELAAWLLSRGAVDAMNLDGGGSVAMVLDGAEVSRPPAYRGHSRKIANGVMVSDRAPLLLPATVAVTASAHRVKADGATPVRIVARVTDSAGHPVADGTEVYFSTTGGVISARATTVKGRAVATFTPLREAGTTKVMAWCGLTMGSDDIAVEAGPPRRIAARVVELAVPLPSEAPSGVPGPAPTAVPERVASVEIMVLDAWDNALPGEDVEIDAGGSVQHVQTGPDGIGRLRLPLGGQTLTLAHSGLAPVHVALP
jgi:exopolysaccharide biosynthesis protein